MRLTTLLAFLFTTIIIRAQETIRYEILKDDPNYFIHGMAGTFMDAELGLDDNIRPGLYGKAVLNLGNTILIKGEYLSGVKKWDRTIRNSATDIDKSYLDINGRITINLQKNSAKELTKVVLSKYYDVDKSYEDRDGDGVWDTEVRTETSSEQYIAVPATTLTTAGFTFSAGYYQNNVHQEKEQLFLTNGEYIKNLGTNFSGIRFSAGMNVGIVRNIKIDAFYKRTGEQIGKRRTSNRVDAGFEVLYMPNIEVQKEVSLKKNGQSLMISNEIATQKWGGRLFAEFHLLTFPWLGIRAEAGSRPGLKFMIEEDDKIGSLYMQVGAFISLGM